MTRCRSKRYPHPPPGVISLLLIFPGLSLSLRLGKIRFLHLIHPGPQDLKFHSSPLSPRKSSLLNKRLILISRNCPTTPVVLHFWELESIPSYRIKTLLGSFDFPYLRYVLCNTLTISTGNYTSDGHLLS